MSAPHPRFADPLPASRGEGTHALRIAAIVRADFLIRFRRASTVVIFLLLSAVAYLWVPPPSSGRALMRIGQQRALYDSAAVGIATALLGAMFVGLAGFYVVSSAIRGDVASRCGSIIAATTVRNGEYLAGKFLGNVVFLATFLCGFMVASMAMVLVRGEGPLRPLVFLWEYALLASGTILLVSVLAIVFESVPWLSGRLGDVLYFILWAVSFAIPVAAVENHVQWVRYIDFHGLAFLETHVRQMFHTNAMSIGSSPYNAANGVAVVPPLAVPLREIVPRITSTLAPLLLLPIALVFFHRFDPARTRAAAAHAKRSWLGRINGLVRPIARLLFGRFRPPAALADAQLTVISTPLIVAAAIVFALLPPAALPIAFAAAGIFIADVSTRERRAGTEALVFAAPGIREHFVAWKMISSVLVALLILAVPIARSAAWLPNLAGVAFVCAAATFLGVISGNAKTFIVLFLSFWYVAVNDKGAMPALDFAGFFGVHPRVAAGYAIAAAVLLAVTSAFAAARRKG